MTDKEFKRLSRSQLIEIIYQFQMKVEELSLENQRLTEALEDKRLRIARVGNIAEAALEVNNVMQAAQNAAQQYLDEIQTMRSEINEECRNIKLKAMADAEKIVERAIDEGAEIIARAQIEADSIASLAKNR